MLLRDYKLVDLGFLDERIKHVEDTVCAPNLRLGVKIAMTERDNIQATCLATISQHDQFLLSLGFHSRAPNVEGLELIDKLVDDIP